MIISQADVVNSVREHLERQGYEFFYSTEKSSTEISANKEKEEFIIEAVGETTLPSMEDLVFAIGKIVKRMKKQGFWVYYGIAMPKSYFKLLKDFEAGGFQALKLHIFLVDSYISLTHLSPTDAIDLIKQLKTGNIVNPDSIGIDSGLI